MRLALTAFGLMASSSNKGYACKNGVPETLKRRPPPQSNKIRLDRSQHTLIRWPTGDDPEVVVAFPPKRDSSKLRHEQSDLMLAAAGVGHSRGSLVFVDESAEEVTAAHGPGCCRLLGRGRLVGRSEVERAVGPVFVVMLARAADRNRARA